MIHFTFFRYEPNYAPNVSLAPVQKCKGEDDDEEEDSYSAEKKRAVTPEPGPSKTYREWDLSESDDSTVERSSPPQGSQQAFASCPVSFLLLTICYMKFLYYFRSNLSHFSQI